MLDRMVFYKKKFLCLFFWLCIIYLFICFFNDLPINLFIVALVYLIFNFIVSFFPNIIRMSMPMIIIRITGLARYVIIPIAIFKQNVNVIYTFEMRIIMILELMAILIGTFVFLKKNESKNKKIENHNLNDNNASINFSIINFVIVIIGFLLVFFNKSYLAKFLIFNNSLDRITGNVSGGVAILLSFFFLLIYIFVLKCIKMKTKTSDLVKIILSFLISGIYIYGTSKNGNNLSRWNFIVTGIISYVYLSKLYSKYAKKMLVFLVAILFFSITFASAIKFSNNSNYGSLSGIVDEVFNYNTLNAYFSGPKNMQIGLALGNDIQQLNISKVKLFLYDTFGNFPVLNRYIVDNKYLSSSMFNYKIYGSTIAADQIIPYSCQLYNIFGVFFLALESFQIYLAFHFYFICKNEKDFLKIFCYIYFSFFLSLVNCINFSIVMQTLWINVLPTYLISKISKKTLIKKYN